ncbi:MAG: transcriptional regulator, AraC family [Lacrimispora sp.]|jgi:AraC-like DNA-binding protein|nr:transcriptional regulator, AraC family [Lacrimispora sp.]
MDEELLKFLRNTSEEKNGIFKDASSIMSYYVKEAKSNVVDKGIVIEAGRLMGLHCQPPHIAIPDHSHNYVELVYMYSGSTTQVINKTNRILLETYDLLLLRQGTSHAIEPAGEDDIAVHFFLMPEFFSHPSLITEDGSILRHFIAGAVSENHSVADYLHFRLQDILPARNLLENMIWSLMVEKKCRQEINQATMSMLIMELLHDADKVEFHDVIQYEEQIALTAYQYLENNYSTATLEEFSLKIMQPTYYVSRLFKRYYQMTFTECLQLIRLCRAANCLTASCKPVEEIIQEIGYENSSYFHRLFKERYGLTPKQYRDKSRL